jgi:hypothetical protein
MTGMMTAGDGGKGKKRKREEDSNDGKQIESEKKQIGSETKQQTKSTKSRKTKSKKKKEDSSGGLGWKEVRAILASSCINGPALVESRIQKEYARFPLLLLRLLDPALTFDQRADIYDSFLTEGERLAAPFIDNKGVKRMWWERPDLWLSGSDCVPKLFRYGRPTTFLIIIIIQI